MFPWNIVRGTSPLITAAIHDGHDVGPVAQPYLALDDDAQLREEDPFTGHLAEISDTRIVVRRSRFEVDLNRPTQPGNLYPPRRRLGIAGMERRASAESCGRWTAQI